MKCSFTGEQIAAYLDGELGAAKSKEFEQHVKKCSSCFQTYQAQKAVQNTLRANFSHWVAPGSLRNKINRALEDYQPELEEKVVAFRFPWFSWHGFSSVAIAAAVLLLLFFPMFTATDISPALFASTKLFISTGKLEAGPGYEITSLPDDGSIPFSSLRPDFSFAGFNYHTSSGFTYQGVKGRLLIYKRGENCLSLWLFKCTGGTCTKIVQSYFKTESYIVYTDYTSKLICPITGNSSYLNLVINQDVCKKVVFAMVGPLSHQELIYLAKRFNSQNK